jgi:hypothetical protein
VARLEELASDLGVQGASLYHHFGCKDEILDAITDQIYATITAEDSGGDWKPDDRHSHPYITGWLSQPSGSDIGFMPLTLA